VPHVMCLRGHGDVARVSRNFEIGASQRLLVLSVVWLVQSRIILEATLLRAFSSPAGISLILLLVRVVMR